MDVTIMLSTISLIKLLKIDYPQFNFKKSSGFLWSHEDSTIYYVPENNNDNGFLLHELSHGILNHVDYNRDIELVTMEREAWNKARSLAKSYDVIIDDEFIQLNLDTYRDWLHSRSTCPRCEASGLQIKKSIYKCLACNHEWKVNEARKCALRRYSQKG
jgi:hypothetical protein